MSDKKQDELREAIERVPIDKFEDGSPMYLEDAFRTEEVLNFYDAIMELVLPFATTLADERLETVNRLEVIDATGRAYVKGAIYGSPVNVELSYQDDDRTLKVFVNAQQKEGSESKTCNTPRTGPLYWDWRCLNCDQAIKDHPRLSQRLMSAVRRHWPFKNAKAASPTEGGDING